jgi:hypothetical protein
LGADHLDAVDASLTQSRLQVVFKSCKLIPVMIGGVFLQRKKYMATDYIASGLLSLGLIIFTLADVKVSPQYSVTGTQTITLCSAVVMALMFYFVFVLGA